MARIFTSLHSYKGKTRFIWIDYKDDTSNDGVMVKQQYTEDGGKTFVDIPKDQWTDTHPTTMRRLLRDSK